MIYYRIAVQTRHMPTWRWMTTKLTSLHAVLNYLQIYRCPQHARLRVFFASSVEALDELLALENQGGATFSVPAEQVLGGQLQEAEVAQRTGEAETQEHKQTLATGVATREAPHEESTDEPPLHEGGITALEARRLEIELGVGGDHDTPYTFAFPPSMPQRLAWIRLRTKLLQEEPER